MTTMTTTTILSVPGSLLDSPQCSAAARVSDYWALLRDVDPPDGCVTCMCAHTARVRARRGRLVCGDTARLRLSQGMLQIVRSRSITDSVTARPRNGGMERWVDVWVGGKWGVG